MKSILFVLLSIASIAQAGEKVVKRFDCQSGSSVATVIVRADQESKVSTVEWTVKDGKGNKSENMGYMYGNKGLSQFNSIDTDERMEIEGKVLTLTDDSKPEQQKTFLCR